MRSYLILALIMVLFTYLSPREEYKKYFQFTISLLMAVVILRPAIELIMQPSQIAAYLEIDEVVEQIEQNIEQAVEIQKD